MIEELTAEQKVKLAEYRDKWIAIGLSTTPVDFEKAKEQILKVYTERGHKDPKNYVFIKGGSPISVIKKQIELLKLEDTKENRIKCRNDQVYGSQDANWLGFYDFFLNVLDLKACEPLRPLIELAHNCGWWAPYDDLCIIGDTPDVCKVLDGKLHCDGGPAVSYGDGLLDLYRLNGVEVPKWLAVTPAHEIDPKKYREIENVEVKAEFIVKVGMDRLMNALDAKVLHKLEELPGYDDVNGSQYELLELNLGDDIIARYIKMINPSIGCFHVECVGNECETVEDAMHWRKPDKMREIPIDDENGSDWFLQGDVHVWPPEATSLKRFPIKIT